jgi:serine/threonine-protein kinase
MSDRRETYEKPDPYVGKLFDGRYEVVELLGVGGMGAVYKARQLKMDRMVALKVIHQHLAEDETVVKRFNREMKTTSRIGHPNVISVFDFGQADDGEFYLAMELLNGESLQDRINRVSHLPVNDAVGIGIQVLKALSAAHKEHVIHRDLKPENIMLTELYGDRDVVRVLDFGIATFSTNSGESNARVTASGIMVGTPSHVSPEQISGETLDHRSDLYGFGVVLYQLVTGRLPFQDNERPLRVLQMHMTAIPETPSNIAPQPVPSWIDQLILRLLSKYPDQRPASADEVIASLEQGLASIHAPTDRPLAHTPEPAPPLALEPQATSNQTFIGVAIFVAVVSSMLLGMAAGYHMFASGG